MSKEKRSKRIADKQKKIKRQVKILKELSYDADSNRAVREPNRLGKMHALNCGDPNCYMCGNPRKFFKEETIQEQSHKQKNLHHEP